MTHFLDSTGGTQGELRTSLCGELVDVRDGAIAPTCAACLRALKESIAALKPLRAPDRNERQSER